MSRQSGRTCSIMHCNMTAIENSCSSCDADTMGSFQKQRSMVPEGSCSSISENKRQRKRNMTMLLAEAGSNVLLSERGCKKKAMEAIKTNYARRPSSSVEESCLMY